MYKYKQFSLAIIFALFAFLMPQNIISQNLSFSVNTTSITPNSEIIITNSSTNIPTGYNFQWTFTGLGVSLVQNSPTETAIFNNNNNTFSVYIPNFLANKNNTNLNIKLQLVDANGSLYNIPSYSLDIDMYSEAVIESCTEMPFIVCNPFNNLVCNGDFEYSSTIPNDWSQATYAAPWGGGISTDYYHENATVNSGSQLVMGIPNIFCPNLSLLNTGNSNMGAGGFHAYINASVSNTREYFTQELKSTLVPGQQYTIEMDVILNENSGKKINSLGVLFTDVMPDIISLNYSMIPFTSGVAHFPQADVGTIGSTAVGQWTHLTTTFTAPLNSNLSHITIGNHRVDGQSNVISNTPTSSSSNNPFANHAYYFIDNIKVTPTPAVTTTSNKMLEAEISQHNIDEANGIFNYVIENYDPNITYVWEIIGGTAADMNPSEGSSKIIDWDVSAATGSTLGRIKLTQLNSNCASKTQEYRVGINTKLCEVNISKSEWIINSQSEADVISNVGNYVILSGVTTINTNIKFTYVTFIMAPNAKILLNGNVTLELDNCTIEACDAMWDGISANKISQKIIIDGTAISNSVYGICSRNGADLEIFNSSFYSNLNSIQILSHKDVLTFPPVTFINANIDIYQCNFIGNASDKLSAPYTDVTSETGININKADYIQIGNETKLPNVFTYLKNGIKIYNSRVSVFNNTFKYMNNYFSEPTLNEAAITINANTNTSVFNLYPESSVTIGGDNNKANIFEECYNSVYSNNSKFLINNNVFSEGHQSIFVNNFRNGSVIDNNIFKDILFGIKVHNLLGLNRKLDIEYNYFGGQSDNSSTFISREAISLINTNSQTTSSNRTKVSNNTINFAGARQTITRGINVSNCQGIIVNSNHIRRLAGKLIVENDWESTIGLGIKDCIGATVTDNYIFGFGQSITTNGDLNLTQFSCNELKIYKYGFYWGTSTSISDQGTLDVRENHNEWASILDDNQKLANISTSTNNILNTNDINWYYNSTFGNNWMPNQVTFGTNPNHINPVNCTWTNLCVGDSGPGTSTGGGISNTSGNTTVIDLIEGIDDAQIRDFMFEDLMNGEEYIELQNEFRAYDAEFLYKMLAVDTTMMFLGGDKDADYQSFFEDLKEANIGRFAEVYDLIELGNIDEAIEVNNNITPEQNIFVNLKTVLNIYLNTWCKNEYTLSADEYETLFSIADQTPYEAGDAVYTARIMIGYNPDEHEVAYRLKSNEEQIGENNLVLYPNPAADKVTIEFSNDNFESIDASLKVYTITGRLIYETKFNTINSFKQLSVDMLKNGVYMFQISLSNGIDKSGKLVILKN